MAVSLKKSTYAVSSFVAINEVWPLLSDLGRRAEVFTAQESQQGQEALDSLRELSLALSEGIKACAHLQFPTETIKTGNEEICRHVQIIDH